MDPAAFLALVFLGFGATAVLSAVGLAGGTIIVPSLILLFGLETRYAAGTSILAMFLGICSAALAYLRQGRVDVKLALLFDTLDVIGVALGSYATLLISSTDLALGLGIFLVFASWRLWIGNEGRKGKSAGGSGRPIWTRRIVDKEGRTYEYHLTLSHLAISQAASFLSGVATGLFGIGGGSVDATVMMLIGVPPHLAVATSIFGMTITKSAGVVSHYLLGNVVLDVAIPLAIGTVLGGQIGPRLAKRVEPEILKKVLCAIILLIGIRLVVGRFM